MKRAIAFLMGLCLMLTVLPVSPASALGDLEEKLGGLAELFGGEGDAEGKLNELLQKLSGLKDQLKARGSELVTLLPALKDKLGSLLGEGAGKADSLLSGLKGLLGGDSEGGEALGGLLDGLEGLLGSEEAETDGDDETWEETVARLNSEKPNYELVTDRIEAESMEAFFGDWAYNKMVLDGEESDLSDLGCGAHIEENIFYSTQDGERNPDYPHEDATEMVFENGMLKVKVGELWTTFVLTEKDELVECSNGDTTFLIYYVRK